MDDILNRIKDLKSTIPGTITTVYALVALCHEYGIDISISQKTAFFIALLSGGIGLILSGGKKKEPQDPEK